jgi:hypothetical protein
MVQIDFVATKPFTKQMQSGAQIYNFSTSKGNDEKIMQHESTVSHF